MEEEKAVSLAKEIIELDIKRDEMLETFMQLAGEHAFQLLRCSKRTLPKIFVDINSLH